MAAVGGYDERVLMEREEVDEVCKITLIEGVSTSVTEVTSGPVTEVAYGCRRHGHKMMASPEVFAHVLEVDIHSIGEGLAAFFAGGDGGIQLSDLMDCFDRAGEPYSYVAWTSEGDLAMRG